MIYLDLLFITILIVFIIDLSGFTQSIQHLLKKFLNTNKDIVIKPFMCSLCMTFWTTIIYIILTHNFTLLLLSYCVALSFMTPIIASAMKLIQDILAAIINLFYNIFKL